MSVASEQVAKTPAEACFAATRGLCNECGELVDAKIVIRDEKVYLVKWCDTHGRSEALTCSDVDWFRRSLAYVKPKTDPVDVANTTYRGCPTDCGLCAEHQQHTCVPIIEITDRCDLKCPVCIVGEQDNRHQELSVEEFSATVDHLVGYEGRLNMLNLSGGEPTIHPNFLEIVDSALRPEIGIVSVSTDGLALSRDDDLIKALRDRDVVISLQFDGFSEATYKKLRGRGDLAAIKIRLVQRIIELGAKLSLTVTLARGVNEDELGPIMDLLFEHDNVLSMMVQPLAHTGRAPGSYAFDPLDVITIPDAVRLLAAGSKGVLQSSDFSPLPCSHPSCFALTYLLKTEAGKMIPLPRILETDDYLDIIKNQALFGTDTDSLLKVRDSLYALWSSDGVLPDREAVLKTVRQILLDLNSLDDQNHRQTLDLGAKHVKSIFIHHFMDRYTFDLSRVVKCCNHYPGPSGQLMPACVRNNLHR